MHTSRPCCGTRRASLAALPLLALVLAPATGWAQPASSPGDGTGVARVELAKRHYALGEVYYKQGDFAKALAAFQESHGLSGKPALLYNIGRCQEALGELQPAIDSFERYLADSKATDPDLRLRIQNLRARLTAKTPAPAAGGTTNDAPPRRWMRPTAWALVAVGAAVLGTGVALGVVARSRGKDVEQAYQAGTSQWIEVQPTEDSGKRMQTGMIASVIIGAVAVAGGVTLHLLAPRAERRVSVYPIFDRQLAGLGAGLCF